MKQPSQRGENILATAAAIVVVKVSDKSIYYYYEQQTILLTDEATQQRCSVCHRLDAKAPANNKGCLLPHWKEL